MMYVALGRIQIRLQVTLAPTRTHLTIREARERAERQLAAHAATLERVYRRERAYHAVETERARWEHRRCYP